MSNSHCTTLLLNQMSFLLLPSRLRTAALAPVLQRVTKMTSENLCRTTVLPLSFSLILTQTLTATTHCHRCTLQCNYYTKELLSFPQFVNTVNMSYDSKFQDKAYVNNIYLNVLKQDLSGIIYLFMEKQFQHSHSTLKGPQTI